MAATILKYDFQAGLNLPPKILVLETPEGTDVIYDQPSSLIAIGDSNAELKEAAEVSPYPFRLRIATSVSNGRTLIVHKMLDARYENLVKYVELSSMLHVTV